MNNSERLSDIKCRLDESRDKLNEELSKFEADLHNMGFGVRAFTGGKGKIKLGYTKYKSKWRLVILCKEYQSSDEEILRPFDECEAGLRLYAYRHRFELVAAITATAESLEKRIRKALDNRDMSEEDDEAHSQTEEV